MIERLLALHDWQLSEAPMHRVVEAEKQLRQFLAGTGASPLVRPKSDKRLLFLPMNPFTFQPCRAPNVFAPAPAFC